MVLFLEISSILHDSSMDIHQATYLLSSPRVALCPTGDRPEFAFIGRSNVGKSSLINMLANQKELAKTSGSPGKTQMINHFDINKGKLFWVDLPGYGYAKVSKKQRDAFHKMIWDYLEERTNLRCLFALVDSRHKPQKIDLDFINALGERQVPFAIVFTKSDKSTQSAVQQNIQAFQSALLEYWEELPPTFLTSSVKKKGNKAILTFMEELINEQSS